jgi:hypothetical protein
MRPRPRPRTRATLALVLALAWGCTEPLLEELPPEPEAGEAAPAPVVTGDQDDELLGAIDTMLASIATISDELTAARGASEPAAARSAAESALRALLDDGEPGPLALLPSTEVDRTGASETRDVLTATLTAARDAGGPLGRATVEVLRDPLAGDLGAWERDPAGVVATVEAAITSSGDLEVLEAAVLDLPGDATRALAWTLLATRAERSDELTAYAERALAHLGIVGSALGQLREGA